MADSGGGGGEAAEEPTAVKAEEPTAVTSPKKRRRSSSDTGAPAAAQGSVKKAKAEPESANDDGDSSSDDDAPLVAKKSSATAAKKKTPVKKKTPAKKTPAKKAPAKKKTPAKKKKPAAKRAASDSESSDDEPFATGKKTKKPVKKAKKSAKKSAKGKGAKAKPKAKAAAKPKKPKKEPEPEEPIYKWWEEEPLPDDQKWRTLEHNGPQFPPPYERLPKHVFMKYDGEPYPLQEASEEVATFYSKMMSREYVKMEVFNTNFFKDWKTTMTGEEKAHIKDLKLCDFQKITTYYEAQSEASKAARKAMTKEEKEKEKATKEVQRAKYGFATVDTVKCSVANFTAEPPGLFQGRGAHPKMGKLKIRLTPEDVTINIGDPSKAPPAPEGHSWKKVQSDNKVTWMATWTENIAGQNKYVMLGADTHIKARKDWEKYETARRLKREIHRIRADMNTNLKSKQMVDRQMATALYFIDRLALRAGGEKDTEEEADTVGCCNLRYEHVFVEEGLKIRFDFPGKDSIRYENTVTVDEQVWKNVKIFKKAPKEDGDALFDRLTTSSLNKHLKTLMPGLTAKCFRTYNASITMQEQLKSTPVDGSVDEKNLAYQRANRMVAVLCNHQRGASKTHDESMGKMKDDFEGIEKQIKASTKELKAKKKEGDERKVESLKKKLAGLKIRLSKKEIAMTDKEENKTIALSTSKLNYLDPRISFQWAKTHSVPESKVYNPTQRKKFRWAYEMIKVADETFVF